MLCDKTSFKTKVEAAERINEIAKVSDKETIPTRFYKCQYCHKYHLTSKTEVEYTQNLNVKKSKAQRITAKREKRFIIRETEYWEKQFGIKE